MPFDSRRRELREWISRDVPDRPGVYTWLGGSGEPLYVGKSVNLRSRMLSYLLPGSSAPESRVRHLAFSIRGYEYRETAGELLALLLEDALIKQLNPRHNVRQRDYFERRYLALTDDPYPTCLVVETESPRPGTLFGPFKDRYFVEGLVALIDDEFGLRACQDREPFRRSARFDLGVCPGPCRGTPSPSSYAITVARVRAFLEGDASWLVNRLSSDMKRAADELRFERAGEAKERLGFVRRFAARQRFVRAFLGGCLTANEPAYGLTYSFEGGQLTALTAGDRRTSGIPPELERPATDPRILLDHANILYRWQARHRQPTPAPPPTNSPLSIEVPL